ncbi:MAG: malto-oligosyltrehalose trehalohydrolase [Candidatus Dormiibacterota bacterium]
MTTRRISVWAPAAQRVDLIAGDRAQTMEESGGGWFVCNGELANRDDYAFSVDGSEAMPDPRSRSQPAGVHGPSQLVEHPRTREPGGWRGFPIRDAVIYELHVGTFTPEGTFDAAITHLDHLVEVGANAIELMPVAEFPGQRGWGYDGVDLFAPYSGYGGPDGLRRFIQASHDRHIAVILDVVYNHVGPEGDYLGAFGPYFTDRYETPWGSAFNYDGEDSDEVRRFVLDNAEMWLRDYSFDGLRLDAVHAIIDTSPLHILEAIATRVDELASELGRELWVIAESDSNDPRLVRDRERGGYGLDAQWSDDFHHALHALLTGEQHGYYEDFGSPDEVRTALLQSFVYAGQYSRHRKRTVGRYAGDLPRSRFITYSQNHDQIGNRAAGERLCHLVSEGRAQIAAALTLLSPMVPMLFQGEEWAASTPFQYFTDLGDAHLGKAVTNGRRREFKAFGWSPASVPDPQALATFERSVLNWGEVGDQRHARMLAWYRQLIDLRRRLPPASDVETAATDAWYDSKRSLLMYTRGDLLVCCNLGVDAELVPEAAGATLLLASDQTVCSQASPSLNADAVAVWSLDGTRGRRRSRRRADARLGDPHGKRQGKRRTPSGS